MVKRSQDRARAREQAQNLEQIHAHMKALEGENRALINRNDSIKQELIEAQARTPAQALVPPQSHLPQARTPAQAQVQDQARTPAQVQAQARDQDRDQAQTRTPAPAQVQAQARDQAQKKLQSINYNCEVVCKETKSPGLTQVARQHGPPPPLPPPSHPLPPHPQQEETPLPQHRSPRQQDGVKGYTHKYTDIVEPEQQTPTDAATLKAKAAAESVARQSDAEELQEGGSTSKRKKGGKKSKKYKRKTNKKKVLKKRKVTKKKRTRRR